jgi:hypothetical protein
LKVFKRIMLMLFLAVIFFTAVPMKADPAVGDPVKIAVVGPQGWIQWDGIWVGAKMAQEKINLGPDGIDGTVDDGTYFVFHFNSLFQYTNKIPITLLSFREDSFIESNQAI